MVLMAPRSSYQLRQVLQHLIQPLLGGWRPQQCQGRTLQRSTDYLICKDNHKQRRSDTMWLCIQNLYRIVTICHNAHRPANASSLECVEDGLARLLAACLLLFELVGLVQSYLRKGSPIPSSACDGPTLPQYSYVLWPAGQDAEPQRRLQPKNVANKLLRSVLLQLCSSSNCVGEIK